MRLKSFLDLAARTKIFRQMALKVLTAYLTHLKRQINAASNPSLRFSQLAKSPLVPLRALDMLLLTLLGERDPLFMRILAHESDIKSVALRVLLRMYGADYRGLAVNADEIRTGLKVLENTHWRPVRSNMLYFMLAAIKNGNLHLVREVLTAFPAFPLRGLPSAYKIGTLRLAVQQDKSTYAIWRQEAAPSALELLQIQDIDQQAGFASPLPHAKLGMALRAVVSPPMQAELDSCILPFYANHSVQMAWMDCRNDISERNHFINDIEEHLQRKLPYSLIRLGDGESYAWKSKISAEHAARREQAWWGTTVKDKQREQIADAMLNAISKANRLGIPSLFRFTRDTHPELNSYKKHISILGLIHVLDGLRELSSAPRLYTEERIHQICFDLSTIAKLCASAQKVVVVSSLTQSAIETKLRSHIGNIPLEVIEVPTHTKTRGNKMFVQAEQVLPFVYEDIEKQVANSVFPGTLVLVASGSIGKIFCATAQKQSGVALDIGSMADYWVDLKTRSIADLA